MKAISCVALLLCSGLAAAARDTHPIENVINLLKDLELKVEGEGKTEALSFQKFEHWCRNSEKTLNKAIAEEKDTIESLESKIDGKTKEKTGLENQIEKLEDQISKMGVSAKSALDQRESDNALYVQADTDVEATISAVEDCIDAIKQAKSDVSLVTAKRHVQKVVSLLEATATVEELSTLNSFAATVPDAVMAAGDEQAHVKTYKFKGGSVLELLKQLLLKFEDDLSKLTKQETNAVNSYTLSKEARDNALDAATNSKDDKTGLLGEVSEELSQAESDLKDENDELTTDTTTLESTQKSCAVKKQEWDDRCKVRDNEMAAMAAAIKILAKVGGVRTEAPENPVPPPSPVAVNFLQVSSVDPKMKAVTFLREKAHVLHAKALERLAQEISTHLTGPFDEVNNMIEKMIFRLMAEQKDEDDHKNWCDLELEKTAISIDKKNDKVADLSAKIGAAEATVNQLTEEIKDANTMIADVISFMTEATEIRKLGKGENAKSLKDAEDAMKAIANAVAVLRDFYKSSGEIAKEPWEFLQRGVELPAEPTTWEASYTGTEDPQGQPDGIISVLEATSEDFSIMAADTKAQEASDQKAFEEDMQQNEIEKAKRSKEAEMKDTEKRRLVDKINSMQKQKKHTADELEATEQYERDLQPACVEGDSTYEDRKAARTQETEALRQAQGILTDAFKEKDAEFVQKKDAFLQRKQITRA